MTVTVKSAASLVTGALLLACATHGAAAAPTPVERSPTKVAEASQAQPVAAIEDDEITTCNKSRKRLWVEGEGWIVRRVTICR